MANQVENAFDIARQALQFVGEFQTPPTPEVYEVWFRYVQGSDPELHAQLKHAVETAGKVSGEFLTSLHEQFCRIGNETEADIGKSLSAEIDNFQLLVSGQQQANTEFGNSLQSTNEKLARDEPSKVELAICVSDISDANSAMQRQLSDVLQKLADAERNVAALQTSLEQSQRGMMTDHLTGVGNRRYFDTLVNQIVRDRAY